MKKRNQTLLNIPRVQFPNNIQSLDFSNSISQYRGSVNSQYTKNSEKDTRYHVDVDCDGINGQFVSKILTIGLSEDSSNEWITFLHENLEVFDKFAPEETAEIYDSFVDYALYNAKTEAERDRILKTIRKYQNKYRSVEGEKTYRAALKEYVNDHISDVFDDVKGASQYIAWLNSESGYTKEKANKILNKLGEYVEKIVEKIMEFIDKLNLNDPRRVKIQLGEKQANEIRDLFFKAGDAAIENIKRAEVKNIPDTDIRYQVDMSFSEQVESILDGTFDKNTSHVYVGETPSSLTNLGIKNLPMLITSNHIYSMSVSEAQAKADGRYNKNTNYHDLGDTVKQLPEAIKSPAMIIKSNTDNSNTDLVIVTTLHDKNNCPIIAAIKVNGKGLYNGILIDTNLVASAYGKNNFNNYLQRAVNENRILMFDQKRSQTLLNVPRVQFPNGIQSLDLSNSISQYRDSVNSQYTQNSEEDTRRQIDIDYMQAVKDNDTEKARQLVGEYAEKSGYTIKAYHGTSRADRVGTVFRADRATSGPMAYFTDTKSVAEGYAKTKADTSIEYEEGYDSYETQFRVKTKNSDIPVADVWRLLPADARKRIENKAGHVRIDWDSYDEIITDPNTNEANGGFSWQIKEAKGNIIQALTEQWLNSGTLYNEEHRYLDVLEMTGVFEELEKAGFGKPYYNNPDYREEKVYETYLKLTNPFYTSSADNEFKEKFLDWYGEQDLSKYEKDSMYADMWDKNNITGEEWAEERLADDIENNSTRAWTTIPDSVTDFLKYSGYDGVADIGGKYTGDEHTVYIPFYPEQIKSAETVTYDDDGNVIPLSERFSGYNEDIRYQLDIDNGEDISYNKEKGAEENGDEKGSRQNRRGNSGRRAKDSLYRNKRYRDLSESSYFRGRTSENGEGSSHRSTRIRVLARNGRTEIEYSYPNV